MVTTQRSLTAERLHFLVLLFLTCQNPLHRLQIVYTAGPVRLARQKTESLKDENDEPYTAEFEAP